MPDVLKMAHRVIPTAFALNQGSFGTICTCLLEDQFQKIFQYWIMEDLMGWLDGHFVQVRFEEVVYFRAAIVDQAMPVLFYANPCGSAGTGKEI